jgi:hypothetical protein
MATSSAHKFQFQATSPARGWRRFQARLQGIGALLPKADHWLQLTALYAALALIAGVAFGTLPVRPF